MLRFAAFVVACVVALVVLALWLPSGAPPAAACTGGVPPLEWLTSHGELIVLGEAIEVGDGLNRAPTATATQTPTVTSTPRRGTSSATPTSPAATPSTFEPRPFDLTGIGMTLRVERVYVGQVGSTVPVDWTGRSWYEKTLRDEEAGKPYYGGTCTLGMFQPRYRAGQRYLLFAQGNQEWHASGSFAVDGDAIVGDSLLGGANNGFVYMSPGTYEKFFRGVQSRSYLPDRVDLTAERIPLSLVMRAVAYLRGDASIAPPETGSAGLASGRR